MTAENARPVLAETFNHANALPSLEDVVRRAITVVACLAILAAALPLAALSWYRENAAEHENLRATASILEQRLNLAIAALYAEVDSIAETPIVATALTDTAGRHIYLSTLLEQRAAAIRASIVLRDYRGRPVIAFPERDADAILRDATRTQPPGPLPLMPAVTMDGSVLVTTAPVLFAATRQAIGQIELRVDLARLLPTILAGAGSEYEIAAYLDGREIYSTGSRSAMERRSLRIVLPGEASESFTLELDMRARSSSAQEMILVSLLATAVLIGLSFMGAFLTARRMARSLTHPLDELARASLQHKRGEARPAWTKDWTIREFAILGTTVADAFDAQERMRQRARYDAEHDALTNLINRAAFDAEAARLVEQAAATQERVALLYLDLDKFKPVNDRHGHSAGDVVLRIVAERLQHHVRRGDLVSRRGGDEFVVLLCDLPTPESTVTIGRNLIAQIEQPIQIAEGLSVYVSASIGIAIAPEDGYSMEALLTAADSALYWAKAHGKGRCHIGSGRFSEIQD